MLYCKLHFCLTGVLFSSTDTFQKAGWKLQSLGPSGKPSDSLQLESHLFYGLGSCPPKTHKLSYFELIRLKNNSTEESVVDFYLTIFRTYCSEEAREYLQYLLKENYLKISKADFIVPKEVFQS
jgi:hypothetical protein